MLVREEKTPNFTESNKS